MEMEIHVFFTHEEQNKEFEELEKLVNESFERVRKSLLDKLVEQKVKATTTMRVVSQSQDDKDKT